MDPILSHVRFLVPMLVSLTAICTLSDCYDPLDPKGNITVTFDITRWTSNGYVERVTVQNYYLHRHVEFPGWKLGWTWASDEVIMSMNGAFATQQGNCSSFKDQIPHSCNKAPSIKDCCRGGRLAAWAIDPANSFSSFEMTIIGNSNNVQAPRNLILTASDPGYTCSQLEDSDPTVYPDMQGGRQVQVIRTWKSICTYSTFLANKVPSCCVSLSTFYNPKITSCPKCSCGCRVADQNTFSCIKEPLPLSPLDVKNSPNMVQCTDHMCPVRVHWHVIKNYISHWRVKLTITNYNLNKNFTDWNLLVQHPGFIQDMTVYSFNSTILPSIDGVALFWGISYYNDELMHSDEGQLGSVTTQILLKKDGKGFTLRNGWAFPITIYFNGENCQMPPPDIFPMLPNGIFSSLKPVHPIFLLIMYSIFKTFVAPWF